MSHVIKEKTRTIQITNKNGHVCKVYDFLMWAMTLRGVDHKHTVGIKLQQEKAKTTAKRRVS